MAVLIRKLRLPLAFCLLVLGLSPAFAVFGGKVVGDADPLAHAVAAILYQDDTGAHLCTATALSPRLLLTAAHCTAGDKTLIRVIFSTSLSSVGDDRIRTVASVRRARTEASAGTYAYNNPDDVALVLLNADAPAGTTFASLADAVPGPDRLRIAGYGATSDLRKPGADGRRQLGFDKVLRTTTVPLLSAGASVVISDQTKGTGACTGDSGAPAFTGRGLVVAGLLIGVSSTRDNNDYCRGKAYFATVARLKPWILAAAKAFGQPL